MAVVHGASLVASLVVAAGDRGVCWVVDPTYVLIATLRSLKDIIDLQGDGLVVLQEVCHHVAKEGQDACQEVEDRDVVGNGAAAVAVGNDRMEAVDVDADAGREVYGCLSQGTCDYGGNGFHGKAGMGMVAFYGEVSFLVVASCLKFLRRPIRRDRQALSKRWRPRCVQLRVLCCTEFR